jgi:uncharacterized Ntn-hydrolase superfamily protein
MFHPYRKPNMTFSVAARCGKSGQFAVAVASSSPAVAARCAYARSGAGAVTTQNVTDPRLGPLGLDLMERGLSANAACEELQARAGHIEFRQLTLVDRHGRTAVYSGAQTLGRHASAQGRDVVAAGNMLAHEGVPAAIMISPAAFCAPCRRAWPPAERPGPSAPAGWWWSMRWPGRSPTCGWIGTTRR